MSSFPLLGPVPLFINMQDSRSLQGTNPNDAPLNRSRRSAFPMMPLSGTPAVQFQDDANSLRSPPPLNDPYRASQALEADENLDILLPVISDDFDDEDLFGRRETRDRVVKKRFRLPVRPKRATTLSSCHTICFVGDLPLVLQEILLPMNAGQAQKPLSLPMKRSAPLDNPV